MCYLEQILNSVQIMDCKQYKATETGPYQALVTNGRPLEKIQILNLKIRNKFQITNIQLLKHWNFKFKYCFEFRNFGFRA